MSVHLNPESAPQGTESREVLSLLSKHCKFGLACWTKPCHFTKTPPLSNWNLKAWRYGIILWYIGKQVWMIICQVFCCQKLTSIVFNQCQATTIFPACYHVHEQHLCQKVTRELWNVYDRKNVTVQALRILKHRRLSARCSKWIVSKYMHTYRMAWPKNEEGRTGADAQTDANRTDRHKQDRQTQAQQADAIGTDRRRQKSDKTTASGRDGQAKTQTKRPPNNKDHNSQSSKTNRRNN